MEVLVLLFVFLVLISLLFGAPIALAMLWAKSRGRRTWLWFFGSTTATTALVAALGIIVGHSLAP
jgi:hypothetical protein